VVPVFNGPTWYNIRPTLHRLVTKDEPVMNPEDAITTAFG
jgi:hypothetical protein